MKKRLLPWALGVFILLTTLASAPPTVLLALAADNTDDGDSLGATVELRAQPQLGRRIENNWDPRNAFNASIAVHTQKPLFNVFAIDLNAPTKNIPALGVTGTFQIRAPPCTHIV